MDSLDVLRPLSPGRASAIWEISAHQNADSPARVKRILTTILRCLDLHGRVLASAGAVCVLRKTSLASAFSWLLVALAGRFLLTGPGHILPVIGIVFWLFAIPSAASAIEAWRQSRQFSTGLSHLLSDVVRRKDSVRGSGATLVSDVMSAGSRKGWAIGGIAANARLIERFYRPLGWHVAGQLRFYSPASV